MTSQVSTKSHQRSTWKDPTALGTGEVSLIKHKSRNPALHGL